MKKMFHFDRKTSFIYTKKWQENVFRGAKNFYRILFKKLRLKVEFYKIWSSKSPLSTEFEPNVQL